MPDKYVGLRTRVKEIFSDNQARYGYRRIHAQIKGDGSTVSEKIIRCIMKEEQLLVPLRKSVFTSPIRGKSVRQ